MTFVSGSSDDRSVMRLPAASSQQPMISMTFTTGPESDSLPKEATVPGIDLQKAETVLEPDNLPKVATVRGIGRRKAATDPAIVPRRVAIDRVIGRRKVATVLVIDRQKVEIDRATVPRHCLAT